jgi:hypothetical protein
VGLKIPNRGPNQTRDGDQGRVHRLADQHPMASKAPPPAVPGLRRQQVRHGHLHDSKWSQRSVGPGPPPNLAPAGSSHVHHQAAAWPSPGGLSCPLSPHQGRQATNDANQEARNFVLDNIDAQIT